MFDRPVWKIIVNRFYWCSLSCQLLTINRVPCGPFNLPVPRKCSRWYVNEVLPHLLIN